MQFYTSHTFFHTFRVNCINEEFGAMECWDYMNRTHLEDEKSENR